jgi:hypothetical protein
MLFLGYDLAMPQTCQVRRNNYLIICTILSNVVPAGALVHHQIVLARHRLNMLMGIVWNPGPESLILRNAAFKSFIVDCH